MNSHMNSIIFTKSWVSIYFGFFLVLLQGTFETTYVWFVIATYGWPIDDWTTLGDRKWSQFGAFDLGHTDDTSAGTSRKIDVICDIKHWLHSDSVMCDTIFLSSQLNCLLFLHIRVGPNLHVILFVVIGFIHVYFNSLLARQQCEREGSSPNASACTNPAGYARGNWCILPAIPWCFGGHAGTRYATVRTIVAQHNIQWNDPIWFF